jgi:hypothetical protein
MLSLMEELTSTENKVSFARQAYNDSVMAYNTQREVFPSSIIASTFQFTAAELFVIEAGTTRADEGFVRVKRGGRAHGFFRTSGQARKNTKVLVVYFVIAVACIIASVYLASLLIFYGSQWRQQPGDPAPNSSCGMPSCSSTPRSARSCRRPGQPLQDRRLGQGRQRRRRIARRTARQSQHDHPDERKLRNVIEEMAIAAGVPVPKIYVLDDENGINAFAAGHTPDDAAIGVTRGCLTLLTAMNCRGSSATSSVTSSMATCV